MFSAYKSYIDLLKANVSKKDEDLLFIMKINASNDFRYSSPQSIVLSYIEAKNTFFGFLFKFQFYQKLRDLPESPIES